MSKILKFLMASLVLFLLGCGDDANKKNAVNNAEEASKNVVYKVGSSADYPPFEYLDENNKIVEHWDSIQEVIKETKSGRTMY